MTGFVRALRGELYALVRRRQVRVAAVLVVLASLLRVFLAYLWPRVVASEEAVDVASAYSNFWPRFAQGAQFGFILVELAVIVVVGGALPREIGHGAARDPMVRRISRQAFAAARACVAVILPVGLAALALLSAAVGAAVFFDAGHVVTAPIVFDDTPERRAAFADWCDESGVRPDELAAWRRLMEDEELTAAASADRLGLPEFTLPEEFDDLVPFLQFYESDIRGGILDGLVHGALPLLVLGLFAFAFSVLMPTGVLSSGLALGAVILFGVFLADELGDTAWWFFANWLPGMGHDSQLELARIVADGFGEPTAAAGALGTGTAGAGIAAVAFSILVLAVFPRRRL